MNKKRTSSKSVRSTLSPSEQIGRTITIVGRSRVGKSLAKAILSDTNYELQTHFAARSKNYPSFTSDVLFIAAKDDEIEAVAKKAVKSGSPKLIVHFAGSQSSTILPAVVANRLTLHPIQTFGKPGVELFNGVTFMVSSESAAAIRWAKIFVKEIGGAGVIQLEASQLVLYHAMMVFAASFQVLLGGAIEELSKAIGLAPRPMKKAMRPLMQRVLTNLTDRPSHDILTGPIRRKDFETIKKHQKALRQLDPGLRTLYDAFLEYAISHNY